MQPSFPSHTMRLPYSKNVPYASGYQLTWSLPEVNSAKLEPLARYFGCILTHKRSQAVPCATGRFIGAQLAMTRDFAASAVGHLTSRNETRNIPVSKKQTKTTSGVYRLSGNVIRLHRLCARGIHNVCTPSALSDQGHSGNFPQC